MSQVKIQEAQTRYLVAQQTVNALTESNINLQAANMLTQDSLNKLIQENIALKQQLTLMASQLSALKAINGEAKNIEDANVSDNSQGDGSIDEPYEQTTDGT